MIVHKIYKFIQKLFPSLHVGVAWREYKRRRYFKMCYANTLRRLRKNSSPYKVLFLATDASRWKLDSLYKLMKDSPFFEPKILVCPIVNRGKEYMLSKMEECYKLYKKNYGDVVYRAYDFESDAYMDVKDFQPDIVFFTIPYKSMNDERYYIDKFPESLLCYTNYFYVDTKETWFFERGFHELVFRYYIENNNLKKIIGKISPCKPKNCRVVGYPLFDTFRQHEELTENKKRKMTIIIWAPHHSISDEIAHKQATFLQYADFMQQIVEAYKDKIHFVFKPHPELQNQLYRHPDWGKEKTDNYYSWWANGKNTSYVTGEYVDLFLSSCAMIHDCGSFLIEYIYTGNPVMFLDAGNHESKINDVAKEARKCHYIGTSSDDIQHFIDNIVLGQEDPLADRRAEFNKKYIIPANGKMAAENIMDDLLTTLGRK